ncbi:serine hydrolase domain-containing protein [Mucilaginibacter sp. UR6-11]|uniref:serine hydrolase domain-containing protein n=1 Tax=Mucilaginibacter sp. UR6-11 TaxID=1435644 RepID=UPI001E55A743|nr:serine hydrolase domain-containing protein [Mucilaginibacter sp. UR6-11]MCC8424358.1 serine hydrolase [Mucilaginibacter sp. UR6-11]
MKKVWLLIALFTGVKQLANAQNIDTIVKHAALSFMSGGPRVGLSVGIIKKGEIYRYHFGSSGTNQNSAPTDQTIYEIGSLTKTFSGRLLAQAVIENRVSLTDDIRKYLKGDYQNLEYHHKPITLKNLANWTSCLPDNLPEKPTLKAVPPDSQLFEARRFHDGYTRQQFFNDLHSIKLTAEPGSHLAHSNTAAQLMGFILEDIYGMSYEELLRRYVTGPLKMPGTFVTVPASKRALLSRGYNAKGMIMPEIPKDAGSAGVLKSSIADMVRYLGDQLSETNKAVKLTHQPTWGSPETLAIGLNWFTKTNFDGQREISGSGGTFGYSCYMAGYPAKGFGIVILTNENDNQASDAINDLAKTIYNEIYFTAAQRAELGFGFSRSINLLLKALNQNGFENAVKAAADLKHSDASFKLVEDDVNLFGYHLLNKGEKAKALEIFKLNVSLYPNSYNTYDSLAETYESLGDKVSAIQNYQRVLELNPDSHNATEHLKKLTGK